MCANINFYKKYIIIIYFISQELAPPRKKAIMLSMESMRRKTYSFSYSLRLVT